MDGWRSATQQAYGFPFPEELELVADFAESAGRDLDSLELTFEGPLALRRGEVVKPWDDWPRYALDPPEFFTVMTGGTDGLHWGYWFDAPGERPPVVSAYYHSDAFELWESPTLLDAIREHLEALHMSTEELILDDPEEAAQYREDLASYARLREGLRALAPDTPTLAGEAYLEAKEHRHCDRVVVAPTRNRMGVVANSDAYRALAPQPRGHDWRPSASEALDLAAAAVRAAEDGFPATALVVGHDLWPFREHVDLAADLLRRGYDGLGRTLLAQGVDRAVAYRTRA